ncbi:MAG: TetR/AcrR family transcriptional regulator [Parvibaculum sp.]|uniref:TetR/AcrR family transcriptional regulator n=1 Tax=Parvibaculum sp. TaxID=2024848 RepID=UPI0025CDA786|nr:TetR/AcrR family transcriptional regulator [Parvibaculum sp.]MCE9648776.1 TetR/AcrR family transcriptional regulator [Parvibaculum sp.]
MVAVTFFEPPLDVPDTPEGRIVLAARDRFFAVGYQALTVDALAETLCMSKKTIYKHFRSKEEIVAAAIDAIERTIRRETGLLLGDRRVSFTRKLYGVMAIIGAQYGKARPELLRELAQAAPALHRKIDRLRRETTPAVIGTLIRAGIDGGMVRDDVDVDFAVEMWIAAASGLLEPATLDRLGLTPRAAVEKGIELFFQGVLTARGDADLNRQRRLTD